MKFYPAEIGADEILPLNGRLAPSILELNEEGIKAESEVVVSLNVQRDGETMIVLGRVETKLQLMCGRCMEWMEWPIAIDDFCVTFEPPLATSIDLTESIREDIILRLPLRAACQLDEKHRCPLSGKLFPPPEEAPGSILGGEIWQDLDKLKIKE